MGSHLRFRVAVYGLEVKGVHSSGSGFGIPVPTIHANHPPAQWGEALQ